MHFNPLFLLLFLALAAYGQQERVAILNTVDDHDSIGVSDLIYLTTRFREIAINTLPSQRYAVMSIQSIVAFLGSEEQVIKICNETSCLAQIGRKVSADYVAQARVGRFDRNLTVSVELYSSRSGAMVGSFTGDSKSLKGLRDVIDKQAPLLFKKMPGVSEDEKPTPPPTTTATTPPPPPTPPTPIPTPAPPPEPKEVPPEEPEIMDKKQSIAFGYVNKLLNKDGVKKNKEEIQSYSVYLSPADKEILYNESRKRGAFVYAFMNIPFLFGLGSFFQGDIGIGGTLFITYGLGTFGLLQAYTKTGSVILVSGWIVGLIGPFVHQSNYNKALKEALYIDNNISLSIDPLIVPRDGMPAVGLALNLRY